jgi:hypothetical protein
MNLERKNKFLTVSLITLIFLTLIVFFVGSEKREEINRDLFKAEDLKSVDRVTLQSGTKTIQLHTDGSTWFVNKNFRADPDMIRVLFAMLLQHEPQRRAGAFENDSIAKILEQRGVLVTLFVGSNPIKSFYAGGNPSKSKAYFKDVESGDVYLMKIPGYKVYVSGIFELDESGFREKIVFGFQWRNFKSLSAQFFDRPNENFKAILNKENIIIEGMPRIDTAKVNTFLNDVSLLTADQFLEAKPAEYSNEIMLISIEDIANRKYTLKIYGPESNGKMAGMIGQQPALFDIRKMQLIMRPRSYFEQL